LLFIGKETFNLRVNWKRAMISNEAYFYHFNNSFSYLIKTRICRSITFCNKDWF